MTETLSLPLPPHTQHAATLCDGTVWARAAGLVAYEDAIAFMEARAAAIRAGEAPETVWLLEHPPLYTAGTSARDEDLLTPARFPVFKTGRGGQYTYHGPGQRVIYLMLDLQRRGPDVRRFVRHLEDWLVAALAELGVQAEPREDRVGLWVPRPDGSGLDDKIAAVGVRVKRWVTFHGVSLNVSPDLSHFAGIVPCGIRAHGVTSLAALSKITDMDTVDQALKTAFTQVFNS